ncbi:enoyl-CoA hydratase [Corallococcus praedator]|uniref:Enoyl-CoA hydratase n=1 Tax=Corallococcus praedator TaxID=2316724 RepID=A0ABX9QP68_9BACT|nr:MULTISPECIES: enoyl-CoA hydratase-related protein [Corallococcus]RKH16085.1 enoyl-CoA hydratase [Corallococcus sp. CA047B]RKH36017.1 enoyl-CoA hydratase [Corallococcus sp. CA031C]RKI15235.1 enoyl-CoA hydratase [Corallococcus praedator]
MSYQHIRFSVADRVATLELHRPEARNGFTVTMADELAQALSDADANEGVRVVILSAAGKDFCVGADLSGSSLEVTNTRIPEGAWVEPATRVTRRMFALRKPIIAAIQGAAVGVGSTMILPADFRLASKNSRFGFVFSRRGIYPEAGSSWFLPRIVGMGRALDWMVSGRLINAEEALGAGLVRSLHEPEALLDAALSLAHELVETTAPVSVAVIRQALYRMSALPSPEPAFELDSQLIASLGDSADALEGIMAFMQKRPAKFSRTVEQDLPAFLPWREHTS